MIVRGPLPNEAAAYQGAISFRDEAAFRQLFELYPNVLWGSITSTLSKEDKEWSSAIIQRMNQERIVDEDW